MKRGDLVTVALSGDYGKLQTEARERVGAVIGHVDDTTMVAVNRALATFLGFA